MRPSYQHLFNSKCQIVGKAKNQKNISHGLEMKYSHKCHNYLQACHWQFNSTEVSSYFAKVFSQIFFKVYFYNSYLVIKP
jgi:hypothetical protein